MPGKIRMSTIKDWALMSIDDLMDSSQDGHDEDWV